MTEEETLELEGPDETSAPLPPPPYITCEGITDSGADCRGRPMKGERYCNIHFPIFVEHARVKGIGRSEAVKRKVAETKRRKAWQDLPTKLQQKKIGHLALVEENKY